MSGQYLLREKSTTERQTDGVERHVYYLSFFPPIMSMLTVERSHHFLRFSQFAQICRATMAKPMKNTRRSAMINPAYFHQYNSPNCSRYLNITLPVSLDSPSLRVPNEKGISVMPSTGRGDLRRRSSAILKPWGLIPEACSN